MPQVREVYRWSDFADANEYHEWCESFGKFSRGDKTGPDDPRTVEIRCASDDLLYFRGDVRCYDFDGDELEGDRTIHECGIKGYESISNKGLTYAMVGHVDGVKHGLVLSVGMRTGRRESGWIMGFTMLDDERHVPLPMPIATIVPDVESEPITRSIKYADPPFNVMCHVNPRGIVRMTGVSVVPLQTWRWPHGWDKPAELDGEGVEALVAKVDELTRGA